MGGRVRIYSSRTYTQRRMASGAFISIHFHFSVVTGTRCNIRASALDNITSRPPSHTLHHSHSFTKAMVTVARSVNTYARGSRIQLESISVRGEHSFMRTLLPVRTRHATLATSKSKRKIASRTTAGSCVGSLYRSVKQKTATDETELGTQPKSAKADYVKSIAFAAYMTVIHVAPTFLAPSCTH